ncbi:hypothetical protein ACQIBV_003135 [Yersinia enterocolitica]|uniref:hypothetical protein n=1 Tax=Yersinia sp. 2105 StPb PI TaxID=2507058 RepID=UPI000FFB1B49|nr:hypothetical protein [Yersinia sp. 2105 StPb PI]RXA96938.1 hypothetical protein EQP49_06045 [Yersinia sp. 2105 StPb PI]
MKPSALTIDPIDGEVTIQNSIQLSSTSSENKGNVITEIKFTDLPLVTKRDAFEIIKSRLLELPSSQYGKETVERIVETTKHAMITFYAD